MILVRWFVTVSWKDRVNFFSTAKTMLRLVNAVDIPLEDLLTLDHKLQAALFDHIDAVENLTQRTHIPWSRLLDLVKDLNSPELKCYLGAGHLINSLGISWDSLLTLDPEVRLELYRHYPGCELICTAWIPWEPFLHFPKEVRSELLALTRPQIDDNHTRSILLHLKKLNLSFDTLVHLDAQSRTHLYHHSKSLGRLIKVGIPLEKLLELPLEARTSLCDHIDGVEYLIQNDYLSWDRLVNLETDIIKELTHYRSMCHIIHEANITWDRLFALDKEARLELYRHYPVAYAACSEWISWQAFLNLPKEIRSELFTCTQFKIKPETTFRKINKFGISLERLIQLDAPVRQALYHYNEAIDMLIKAGISVETILNLRKGLHPRVIYPALDRLKKYDWFLQNGILDPSSLLQSPDFLADLLYLEDQEFFEKIKGLLFSQSGVLGYVPAHKVLASDPASLFFFMRSLLEMQKNAQVLSEAPANSGIGKLPDDIRKSIIEWTGDPKGNTLEMAHLIDEEAQKNRGNRNMKPS